MTALGLDRRIAAERIVQIVEAWRAERIGITQRGFPVRIEMVAVAEIVAIGAAEVGVLVMAYVGLELIRAERAGITRKARIHVPVGRRNLIGIERLVEMFIAEQQLVTARQRDVVLPRVLPVLRVELAVIDAVQLGISTILPLRHDKVRGPVIGDLAVRKNRRRAHAIVRVVLIARQAVVAIETIDTVRLQEAHAGIPFVGELMAQ